MSGIDNQPRQIPLDQLPPAPTSETVVVPPPEHRDDKPAVTDQPTAPIDTAPVEPSREGMSMALKIGISASAAAVAVASFLGIKEALSKDDPTPGPQPIPSASASLVPGPEASATATKTPETEAAVEMIGNINVANLGPDARAYAGRLAPNLVNNMTPGQFREAMRITPDMTATDDPTVLAELAFVRTATMNSAGLTPEVLAKALAAGERFDQYVLQNYWIPGFEADSGIGATPDEQEVGRFRDQANRYDVLASIGPEYAPVAKYTLTNVEISPDTDFQATVTMTFKEQQAQIPDSLAMEYRIRPTIAAPVNLSDTHTYSFNLTTVDGKQVWNIEQVQG